MNRHLIPIGLLVVVFVLLLSGGVNAQTAPPNPPALQPSCPYVLRAGIPFAWLRFDASSLSGWSIALYPGQTVQLLDPAAVRWDGVQWWVNVWPNAAPGHGYYWVEIGSLEPRCPPAATATPTLIPGQGAANWRVNDTLMVVARVPFVWLRQFPAPGNPPILTAFPGQQMKIIDATPRLDSFSQWWWNVRDVRTGTIGWVEQISVALLSGSGTLPPSEWLANDVVRVKRSVPFVWLRDTPSSNGFVVTTFRPRTELIITGTYQYDGVQNWWPVGQPRTTNLGWVEEASLEFVRR